MAQSSIHIESGNLGSIYHNDRSKPTLNSIFNDEPNEIDCTNKKAYQIYREELEKRTLAYTQKTKQNIQKNTVTHLSAIVNLNKNHNLNDLNELKNYLEKTLNTKVFQIAIHKDEGHIDTNNNQIKNYHAHIEFMGLDSQGNSVRRKLTKSYLSNLQTFTAQSLSMQRGINYTQEKKRRPKRLDTYEYKRHKELETQELTKKQLATNEELKTEIKTLREQLKQNGAIRADYAKLEQFQKELQEKIKSKDLTITTLQTKLQEYQNNTTNTHIQTKQKNVQIEKYKDVETGFFNRDFYDKFLNKDVLHRRDEDIEDWKIIQKFFKNNDKIALLDINNLSALNKSLGYNETDLIIQNILDEIKKEIKDKQISCCRYRADLGKFILIGQEQEMNNLLNNLKSNSFHQAINKSLMDSGLYNTYDEKLHLKLMSSLSIGSAKFDSFSKIIDELRDDKTKKMKDVITAFKEGVTSAINKANDEMHTYKIVIKDKLGINYSEKYDNSKKQDMNNHYNSLGM